MTHRQFLAWQAWLEGEWNRPDRTDHYLMLVATRVLQAVAKDPEKVTLDQQRIRFGRRREAGRPRMTPEEATAYARAKWGFPRRGS